MIRKIYLLAILLPVLASAQPITLTNADMAVIGNVIPRRADTMTVITGPGPAGANQNWVMTSLSSFVIDESTSVVAPSSTPYAAQFSNSNVAMTNDNLNYVYLNQNNTTATTQGGAGDLLQTGNIIVAPLNPDLTLHQFPRMYGSSFSDTYLTDITIPGSTFSPLISQIRYKRMGTVLNTTDGWGNVTTPVGTYNVLRVRNEDRSDDTIWVLPLIGFPPQWQIFSTKRDTSYSYQWLGNSMKLPVAELNYDSLDQPKTYRWTLLPPIVVGLNEVGSANDVSVYPNPATHMLHLRGLPISEGGTFALNDALGKSVLDRPIGAEDQIDVSRIPSGVYQWLFKGPKAAYRGRLIIDH